MFLSILNVLMTPRKDILMLDQQCCQCFLHLQFQPCSPILVNASGYLGIMAISSMARLARPHGGLILPLVRLSFWLVSRAVVAIWARRMYHHADILSPILWFLHVTFSCEDLLPFEFTYPNFIRELHLKVVGGGNCFHSIEHWPPQGNIVGRWCPQYQEVSHSTQGLTYYQGRDIGNLSREGLCQRSIEGCVG